MFIQDGNKIEFFSEHIWLASEVKLSCHISWLTFPCLRQRKVISLLCTCYAFAVYISWIRYNRCNSVTCFDI